MSNFRNGISGLAFDQDYIAPRDEYVEYVELEDVKTMLDEIKSEVDYCLSLFNFDDLGICLERLKDLSNDLK